MRNGFMINHLFHPPFKPISKNYKKGQTLLMHTHNHLNLANNSTYQVQVHHIMYLNNSRLGWWLKGLEPLDINLLKLILWAYLEPTLLDRLVRRLLSQLHMGLQQHRWKHNLIIRVPDQVILLQKRLILLIWRTIWRVFTVHQLDMNILTFLIKNKEIF